jgi:hypothetical protein
LIQFEQQAVDRFVELVVFVQKALDLFGQTGHLLDCIGQLARLESLKTARNLTGG